MFIRPLALCALIALLSNAALAQEEPSAAERQKKIDALANWSRGPGDGTLGSIAHVKIPAGYRFAGRDDTRKLLEKMENITSGRELGMLAPDNFDWFVVFEFDDCGYVKDDDKADLDANKMLSAMRESESDSNAERRRRGFGEMHLLGWEQPPHYEEATHNLAWAPKFESDGEQIVNYNTRRLGRRGVMEVALVVDPEQMATTLPEFQKLMTGFEFSSGNSYAEFRSGDKVAEYGLAALVTGGAIAVAAKTGLLAKLGILLAKAWKLVVIGVAAVAAAIGKVIKTLTGGREQSRA